MRERRIYDASLPLYAAWSLESSIFTAVVFIQIAGNEVRAIGSKHWKLQPLHTCIEDTVALMRAERWRVRTHITPPDDDHVIEQQFTDMVLPSEPAPKIADVVTLTRRLMATMIVAADANEYLIEAINSYAPREEKHGFVLNAGHTLSHYFVRALEIFAAWRHDGGLELGQWGPAPDYTLSDRARI